MSDIATIDPNLKVESHIEEKELRFFNGREAPFRIYGVFYENGKFRRLPETVAKTVSPGVLRLHANCAGGRIRFRSDSPFVAISAKMPAICRMSHFALTGSAGLDLYAREETENAERYRGSFVPPYSAEDGFESILRFGDEAMRDITIHLPLYSEIGEIYIGVKEKSRLLPPQPYEREKPVVFYGSSITQGGCASRPGNAYENILSRRLSVDHVNLGFSGSAKGEKNMAEYLASLEMSVFVCDYDYNAPTLQHLKETHLPLVRAVRDRHPALPIVLLSRPKIHLTDGEKKRLEVIRKTYEAMKKSGDDRVFFIEGKDLMALSGDEGTVDGCHPTDLGFFSMAGRLEKLIGSIL